VWQHRRPGVLHVVGGPRDPVTVLGDGPVPSGHRAPAVPGRSSVPGGAGLRGGRRRRGRFRGGVPAERGGRLDGGTAGGRARGAVDHVGAGVRVGRNGHRAGLAVPDRATG